jgi:hypothetical protein
MAVRDSWFTNCHAAWQLSDNTQVVGHFAHLRCEGALALVQDLLHGLGGPVLVPQPLRGGFPGTGQLVHGGGQVTLGTALNGPAITEMANGDGDEPPPCAALVR